MALEDPTGAAAAGPSQTTTAEKEAAFDAHERPETNSPVAPTNFGHLLGSASVCVPFSRLVIALQCPRRTTPRLPARSPARSLARVSAAYFWYRNGRESEDGRIGNDEEESEVSACARCRVFGCGFVAPTHASPDLTTETAVFPALAFAVLCSTIWSRRPFRRTPRETP